MENYRLELTRFIKSKYLDMNTEIQNMESKLKEICNDGRYNQSYMQRALREMNNNIKELNANTRKEIQNHLAIEKRVLEEQRNNLLNASVDPNARLANLMLANLGGYDTAISRSIELGDIGTASALLEICKGNNDKLSTDKYIELDTKLYEITKDDNIKNVEYLQSKLNYYDSSTGIISDIEIDLEGDIVEYKPYTYNNTLDSYIDTTTTIF